MQTQYTWYVNTTGIRYGTSMTYAVLSSRKCLLYQCCHESGPTSLTAPSPRNPPSRRSQSLQLTFRPHIHVPELSTPIYRCFFVSTCVQDTYRNMNLLRVRALYVCICVYIHFGTCICTFTCTCTCKGTHIQVHVDVDVYVSMNLCMCIYI